MKQNQKVVALIIIAVGLLWAMKEKISLPKPEDKLITAKYIEQITEYPKIRTLDPVVVNQTIVDDGVQSVDITTAQQILVEKGIGELFLFDRDQSYREYQESMKWKNFDIANDQGLVFSYPDKLTRVQYGLGIPSSNEGSMALSKSSNFYLGMITDRQSGYADWLVGIDSEQCFNMYDPQWHATKELHEEGSVRGNAKRQYISKTAISVDQQYWKDGIVYIGFIGDSTAITEDSVYNIQIFMKDKYDRVFRFVVKGKAAMIKRDLLQINTMLSSIRPSLEPHVFPMYCPYETEELNRARAILTKASYIGMCRDKEGQDCGKPYSIEYYDKYFDPYVSVVFDKPSGQNSIPVKAFGISGPRYAERVIGRAAWGSGISLKMKICDKSQDYQKWQVQVGAQILEMQPGNDGCVTKTTQVKSLNGEWVVRREESSVGMTVIAQESLRELFDASRKNALEITLIYEDENMIRINQD